MNDRIETISEENPKYCLAVDLGTSGAKVALVTMRGEILDSHFEKNELYLLENGGAEQDPAEWFSAIITGMRKVVSKKLVPREDIIAISCGTPSITWKQRTTGPLGSASETITYATSGVKASRKSSSDILAGVAG
mgnify:CR=1 FL=1